MNIPVRIQTLLRGEQDRIEALFPEFAAAERIRLQECEERIARAFKTAGLKEALATIKTPTPEQVAEREAAARAKADEALMGLTRLYLTDDELRSVGL